MSLAVMEQTRMTLKILQAKEYTRSVGSYISARASHGFEDQSS